MLKTNIIFLMFFTFFLVSCNNNTSEKLIIVNNQPTIDNIKEEEIFVDSSPKINDIHLNESKNEINIISSNDKKTNLIKKLKDKPSFNEIEPLGGDIFSDVKPLKKENNAIVQIQNLEKKFVLNETNDQLNEFKVPLTQSILNESEIETEESKAVIAALE